MPNTQPFHVYILKCRDGSYYTGIAHDIQARVDEHRRGFGCPYTFRRRPVFLVYTEEHSSLAYALRRERQIKGWSRRKKKLLIQGLLLPSGRSSPYSQASSRPIAQK